MMEGDKSISVPSIQLFGRDDPPLSQVPTPVQWRSQEFTTGGA